MKRFCPVCYKKHCQCDLKNDYDLDSRWLFLTLLLFGLFSYLVYYFR